MGSFFTNNVATTNGGGAVWLLYPTSFVYFGENVFDSNSALSSSGFGGAIGGMSYVTCGLYDSLFVNNHAQSGAAVRLQMTLFSTFPQPDLQIQDTTFRVTRISFSASSHAHFHQSNVARSGASAVYFSGWSSSLSVINTVVRMICFSARLRESLATIPLLTRNSLGLPIFLWLPFYFLAPEPFFIDEPDPTSSRATSEGWAR